MNKSYEISRADKVLFWGCFIALIATAFGFVSRMFLLPTWGREFGLDAQQLGALAGIGIWPFAVSIILFSLIIDKIGYRVAMFFGFFAHLTYAIMAISASFMENKAVGYQMLYWGSFILALGNGTVEAYINPVVATMFKRDKTKWLNILHAGWPGGLVITGLVVIAMGNAAWVYKVGLIIVPVLIYGFILARSHFPVNERVQSGVSYKEMLQEFGILSAIIVVGLVVREIGTFFEVGNGYQIGIAIAIIVGFGLYVRALGRPLLFFLMLIMIPLATTEIGTDGWITSIMEPITERINLHAGWVLVYTSTIMLVLRFYAGPIIHRFSPLGLLIISSILAIAGLTYLSTAAGVAIIVAATLYGFGKTFFWPTMLGVVSEQCPKGGALTLNAIAGVGMLAVGVLGFPLIGQLQVNYENSALLAKEELHQRVPGLVDNGRLTVLEERRGILGVYYAISQQQLDQLISGETEDAAEIQKVIADARGTSSQRALATMAIFPTFMLLCYISLALYFRSRGGYKPVDLSVKEMSGGIEAPVR